MLGVRFKLFQQSISWNKSRQFSTADVPAVETGRSHFDHTTINHTIEGCFDLSVS